MLRGPPKINQQERRGLERRSSRWSPDRSTTIGCFATARGSLAMGRNPTRRPLPVLAFRWCQVVSRSCADFQILRIVANHRHFDLMVAGQIRIGRGVAERVLRVQFPANFINGLFNGAVLNVDRLAPPVAAAATSRGLPPTSPRTCC